MGQLERRACAVVVVNYGSSTLLRQNLVRVQRACPELCIVVVDNFTSPTEQRAVAELGAEHGWHVELLPINAGFGGGCNAGVRRAAEEGAEAFLLLNPDAFVDAACVDALIAHIDLNPNSIVAPVIRRGDGRTWFEGMELRLADGSMRRSPSANSPSVPGVSQRWLTGACMLIPSPVWDAVGGFNERYFLYWEDVDISTRAEALGIALVVAEDANALHDVGGTQEIVGAGKSPTYYYYSVRNRLMFAVDHLSAATVRRWVSSGRRAAWDILLRGGRRQFLGPVGPVGSIIRGMRDGRVIARASLARPLQSRASGLLHE